MKEMIEKNGYRRFHEYSTRWVSEMGLIAIDAGDS
jgi:hypothetical protein